MAIFLLQAAVLLTAVAYLRPPEYDEAYSIFLTAGDARPAWPSGVFHPADVRDFYSGHASPARIAHDLRVGDVHPPLYFWALEYWRRVFGPSWLAARLLSVLSSVAALAALAWLAAMADVPVIPALLITLLSYCFAYTSTVARGFALAQLLNVFGTALLFRAVKSWMPASGRRGQRFHRRDAPMERPRRDDGVEQPRTHFKRHARESGHPRLWLSVLGGMSLGAASFTNYLAVFIGLAVLMWLVVKDRQAFPPAALGFALFLPGDWYFYMAQHGTRAGQFMAFSLPHALALLAKDSGAAWFGGLPLYAGRAGPVVALALLALFAACLAAIIHRRAPHGLLFTLAAAAMPAGLLTLGLIFNNTPIEIRYLAFSLPFLALLLAGALPRPLLLCVLAVQACAIAGLAFAPSTMQPQGLAALAAARAASPGTLVLVPFGNDGVGVPGPFIAAAPDRMSMELVRGTPPDVAAYRRVIVAMIAADDASRATTRRLLASFPAQCWQRGGADLAVTITSICRVH